jgi:hypothetical protein
MLLVLPAAPAAARPFCLIYCIHILLLLLPLSAACIAAVPCCCVQLLLPALAYI